MTNTSNPRTDWPKVRERLEEDLKYELVDERVECLYWDIRAALTHIDTLTAERDAAQALITAAKAYREAWSNWRHDPTNEDVVDYHQAAMDALLTAAESLEGDEG